MEILRKNFVNTTTQFEVNSNTATVANVLNPDVRFQYASDSFANDATTVSMRVRFPQTTTVDRIALVGHNLKSFTIFYDGVTANTFNLTATSNTSTSDYVSNSSTSNFFQVTPVACTSVSIDMKSTITPNDNKALGYLVVSESMSNFDNRVPSAQNYNAVIDPQNVVHRLSDGGTRIQTLEDKWRASLSFDFLSASTRDNLKVIYDDHDEIIFVPFGTTTGWDAVIFPCVWNGSFDFYRHSDNSAEAGFSGSINLLETPQ